MYYKVIKDNKVIDVLDDLVYLKYQKKHNRMILCDESEAQAFFSSNRKNIWHAETLYDMPIGGYETVELIQIDKFEYEQLKMLCGKTPEEIVDEVILYLLQNNII